jgi:hypothetical protein
MQKKNKNSNLSNRKNSTNKTIKNINLSLTQKINWTASLRRVSIPFTLIFLIFCMALSSFIIYNVFEIDLVGFKINKKIFYVDHTNVSGDTLSFWGSMRIPKIKKKCNSLYQKSKRNQKFIIQGRITVLEIFFCYSRRSFWQETFVILRILKKWLLLFI